jgi:flagellar basal body P-ring formation protein FlgA
MKDLLSLANLVRLLPLAGLLVQPLAARAQQDNILVPVTTIYPGQIIEEQQFRPVPRPRHIPRDMALVREGVQVHGMAAARLLPAGRPVLLVHVQRPKLVRPGMPVNVFYESAGIAITGVAQALEEAAEGELVRARNLETGGVVSGYVQHDGSLRVLP